MCTLRIYRMRKSPFTNVLSWEDFNGVEVIITPTNQSETNRAMNQSEFEQLHIACSQRQEHARVQVITSHWWNFFSQSTSVALPTAKLEHSVENIFEHFKNSYLVNFNVAKIDLLKQWRLNLGDDGRGLRNNFPWVSKMLLSFHDQLRLSRLQQCGNSSDLGRLQFVLLLFPVFEAKFSERSIWHYLTFFLSVKPAPALNLKKMISPSLTT